MPPRYAYWTIIVDNQPTAFRAGALEDIMPTFNRLKEKQPTAVLKWFQNGQLWSSRLDARDASRKRSEQGYKDWPREGRESSAKPAWQPRGPGVKTRAERPDWKPAAADARPKPFGARSDRPDWRPKETSARPRGNRADWQAKGATAKPRGDRPDWRPKSDSARPKPFGARPDRPDWQPKGASAKPRGDRADWRPKSASVKPRADRAEWQPKGEGPRHGSDRPGWRPKSAASGSAAPAERPAPPALGSERRDSKWRPGGDHKDPRQKYKDAKKAKWTRVKQVIRNRSAKRKP